MQGLQQLGVDAEPVLARHGMSFHSLAPTTRIERSLELRIHADLAGATAYEALQVGIRYQRLTYPFGTLGIEPGEQLSALVLTPMAMAPDALRFRVYGEVSGTYKIVRDMQVSFGLDIRAERIDMPYPRPPEAAAYEQHFGCPVSFGHTQARLWMRNEHLRLRLPSADPNAHSMYRAMCDQQLVAQEASTDTLADRVLTHLGLFNGSYPSVEAVATSLGLSERTLRRQLSEAGHSFRDLLAQARYAKAQHLLKHTTQPIEAIAQQLGYAESAAFIHAFKRGAHVTPREFREG